MQSIKTVLLLTMLASRCYGLPVLLVHAKASASAGGTATTSAIDTTGATLIVIGVSNLAANACGAAISDSQSNTYTAIANSSNPNNNSCLWYVCSPSISVTHTFSGLGNYVAIFVSAYSGTAATSCYDGNHSEGIGGGASTVQPGAVTAGQNDSLYITGIADIAGTVIHTINSCFTITDSYDVPGNSQGGAAYCIQAGAPAALNPTWSISPGTDALAATIAVFKPTGGGGGGGSTASRGFTF